MVKAVGECSPATSVTFLFWRPAALGFVTLAGSTSTL
jgi:hypothetical protein